MRTLLTGLLAPALAGVMLLACGGDDSNGEVPGVDAGNDGEVVPVSDAASPPVDAQTKPPVDGGVDAQCNFATFVKGLVANDTTMTALPSADLGQSCKDNQDQAEFQSLFP
jgi:hypothetical protein